MSKTYDFHEMDEGFETDSSEAQAERALETELKNQGLEDCRLISAFYALKAYANEAFFHGCLLHRCDLASVFEFARVTQTPEAIPRWKSPLTVPMRENGFHAFGSFMSRHKDHIRWMFDRCGGDSLHQSEDDFAHFVYNTSSACTPWCTPW